MKHDNDIVTMWIVYHITAGTIVATDVGGNDQPTQFILNHSGEGYRWRKVVHYRILRKNTDNFREAYQLYLTECNRPKMNFADYDAARQLLAEMIPSLSDQARQDLGLNLR